MPQVRLSHPVCLCHLFNQIVELCVLTIVCLLLLCGCQGSDGPRPVDMAGTVLFNGEPLQEGSIVLVPAGSNSGSKLSTQIINGAYQFGGPMAPFPGDYSVEINASNSTVAPPDSEDVLAQLEAQKAQGKRPKLDIVKIPDWYNKHSVLSITVEEQMQPVEFELTSKRPR